MEKGKIYVYKPEDIQKILGIGRSSVYNLLRSGQIKSKKIGKLYRIPVAYLNEYLSGEQEESTKENLHGKGGD